MSDKSWYVDEDTTDAFLDKEDARYASGRTGTELAHDAAERAMSGKSTLKPPPLSDHD